MASAKQLPSKNWRVQLYVGKDDKGKAKYVSFTAPTRRQAEMDAALYKHNQKKKPTPTITVGEAIDKYIDLKAPVLSPATVMGYRSMRRNIFPDLMGLTVDLLTEEVVQQAVSLYSVNHSPKSVRNAFGLLKPARSLLFDMKVTATLPMKRKIRRTIPTHAQIKLLLDTTRGTVMYTVILLTSAIGNRRSEICAIDWDDVDFINRTMLFNKAMVPDENFIWVIKYTKSTESDRIIRGIPDYVFDHLETLPRVGRRIITGITPSAISTRFRALRDKLGLRFRLHDLRLYTASIMHALNVPDKYAMQRMGHSTPHMLRTVYQQLMDDKQEEVNDTISNRLTDLFDPR